MKERKKGLKIQPTILAKLQYNFQKDLNQIATIITRLLGSSVQYHVIIHIVDGKKP